MIKNWILAGSLMLSAGIAWSQQLTLGQVTGNGQLQWNDLTTPFIKVNSYTVEWASRVAGTQVVWNALATIPATNTIYSLEVPMFYRLRADVQGQFPALRMAIFSDPHCMAPSLLVNDGPAFQTYLAQDRKLLAQSHAILDAVVGQITLAQPQVVLVSGDLTKDGEFISHQDVTNHLAQLKAAGAKVFVCPGNHDVNNPHAASYNGAVATPVPSISAADFAALYSEFGYKDALARDPNSLSYVLGGVDFPTFASNFLHNVLLGLSAYLLLAPPYYLSQALAQSLAPAMTEAFESHYQGDESTRPISAQTQGTIADLRSQGDAMSLLMANSLTAIFTDLPPADNNLTINLITGNTVP
jgi:hypothetical protein